LVCAWAGAMASIKAPAMAVSKGEMRFFMMCLLGLPGNGT
jgi:hypothetical protein